MRVVRSLYLLAACSVAVACSGGTAGTPRPTIPPVPSTAVVAPSIALPSLPPGPVGSSDAPTAEQLCSLLTANDWSTYQLPAKAQPTINSDGPGSAYCTWTDTSGAQGGLELDAFVDPTPAIAEDTYQTAADVMTGQPIDLAGVDSALINPNINGTYGALLARAGRFTYSVSLPASAGSQVQLESLAALVLSRAQQYK